MEYSSDSELESQAHEEEIRLYTELYFGYKDSPEMCLSKDTGHTTLPASQSNSKLFEMQNSVTSSTNKIEKNYFTLKSRPSLSVNHSNLRTSKSETCVYTDTSNTVSQNISPGKERRSVLSDNKHKMKSKSCKNVNSTCNISQKKNQSLQDSTTILSYDVNNETTKPSTANESLTSLEPETPDAQSNADLLQIRQNEPPMNIHEKKKRKRASSICSVDSISGKEPLDNLYCNDPPDIDVNCELDTVFEVTDDSIIDTGIDKDDTINTSDETVLNKSSQQSESHNIIVRSKSRVQKIKSSARDDNEVCVLPVPPKEFTTVSLDDGESSSDESIKILDYVKKDSCPKKTDCSPKKLKNKTNYNIILSDSDSASDIDDLDHLHLPTALNLNFKPGVNVFNENYEPQLEPKTPVHSQAIFSKARPPTKRKPMCPKWTQEMTSLYDSDYSDEFSVQMIHRMQSNSHKKWKLCQEDRGYGLTKRKRFEPRCYNCRQFGHTANKCKIVYHCLYCSSDNHSVALCPESLCLKCGHIPPHRYCSLTDSRRVVCSECRTPGHDATLCPDLWRRFHATTTGSTPVVPGTKIKPMRLAYCFNCGQGGHFGHQCPRGNYSNKYTVVSNEIFNYRTPNRPIRRETVPEREVKFAKVKSSGIAQNKPSVICPPISPSNTLMLAKTRTQKVFGYYHKQLKKIIGKKSTNFRIEEIMERTKTQIKYKYGTRGRNKGEVTIHGLPENIAMAKKYMTLILTNWPADKYREFMDAASNRKGLKKERAQDNIRIPQKNNSLAKGENVFVGRCEILNSERGSVPIEKGFVEVIQQKKASVPIEKGSIEVIQQKKASVPIEKGIVEVMQQKKASVPIEKGSIEVIPPKKHLQTVLASTDKTQKASLPFQKSPNQGLNPAQNGVKEISAETERDFSTGISREASTSVSPSQSEENLYINPFPVPLQKSGMLYDVHLPCDRTSAISSLQKVIKPYPGKNKLCKLDVHKAVVRYFLDNHSIPKAQNQRSRECTNYFQLLAKITDLDTRLYKKLKFIKNYLKDYDYEYLDSELYDVAVGVYSVISNPPEQGLSKMLNVIQKKIKIMQGLKKGKNKNKL